MTYSDKFNIIITSSRDKTLSILNAEDGCLIHTLTLPPDTFTVSYVAFIKI